jgi:hypothetical protein
MEMFDLLPPPIRHCLAAAPVPTSAGTVFLEWQDARHHAPELTADEFATWMDGQLWRAAQRNRMVA